MSEVDFLDTKTLPAAPCIYLGLFTCPVFGSNPQKHPKSQINRDSLHEAVVATASRRGSLGKMGDYEAVLGEVRRSDTMRGIWSSYVSASPYAEGVDFEEAVDSAIELARLSELDDLD